MQKNPIEEYAFARTLPISTLLDVMNNRSDIVSLYVAHPVLKEKVAAEKAKKGANATAQAQAPNVRDKDIAEAQGLAALPVDIPMTPGGITGVPMAGGGEVKRFNAGGQQMSLPGFQSGSRGAPMQSTIRPGAGVTAAQAFPGYTPTAQPSLLSRIGSVAKRGLGILGVGQVALGGDNLNVGEEDYLEMLRRLKALGYTEDQIATMPDEMRRQLASGKAIHSGTAAEPKLGPLTGETTAPPEAAPTGTAQISVPSGAEGLASIVPQKTDEDIRKRVQEFSVTPKLETLGKERLEALEKRTAEEKALLGKTLIDNSDILKEAYAELEKGSLSSTKQKELGIIGAYLKASAVARSKRGGAAEGLAALAEGLGTTEAAFEKSENERKKAMRDIKMAERAEKAGNARAQLEYTSKANDKIEQARYEVAKGIVDSQGVDMKTALSMAQNYENQRVQVQLKEAELKAAAGRLAVELKARDKELGIKRDEQKIVNALELAQNDYKALGPTGQTNVDQDEYLRRRAAFHLGVLQSGKLETGTTQPRGRIVNGVYVQNP